MLRRELPQTTFVIIAHRQPKGLDEVRVIDLDTPPQSTSSTPHKDLVPA
jgi:putative ATP-binding cassette transporter